VTFGCLNAMAKLSDEALILWSRLLAAVPGSHLLLREGEGRQATQRLYEAFARQGVPPGRLQFAGRTASRFEYLKLYHRVDLCLDPFPYNGMTTTCDALWMGVPVLALAGKMGPSRQGVRFLTSVGLDELIAATSQDYLRIASEVASDWSRLAALRQALRERMSCSPLVDAKRLTHELETACYRMWEGWRERSKARPANQAGDFPKEICHVQESD
jgi:protein O-GlcNAc transferase